MSSKYTQPRRLSSRLISTFDLEGTKVGCSSYPIHGKIRRSQKAELGLKCHGTPRVLGQKCNKLQVSKEKVHLNRNKNKNKKKKGGSKNQAKDQVEIELNKMRWKTKGDGWFLKMELGGHIFWSLGKSCGWPGISTRRRVGVGFVNSIALRDRGTEPNPYSF